MPWSRLRPGKAHESKQQRRHSIIVPTIAQDTDVVDTNALHKLGSSSVIQSSSSLRPSGTLKAASCEHLIKEEIQKPTSPSDEVLPGRQRFSFLAKRHVSDPQISRTAKDQAIARLPPLPIATAPSIITTAPTDPIEAATKPNQHHLMPPERPKNKPSHPLGSQASRKSLRRQSVSESDLVNHTAKGSRVTFDEPEKVRGLNAPPAYGDESSSSLALPVSRLSESSRSDASSGDHVYATTTTHTVSTTTTFFRLPRRKRNKGPLFPLPVKIPPSESSLNANLTPHGSTGERTLEISGQRSPSRINPQPVGSQKLRGPYGSGLQSPLRSPSPPPNPSLRRDSTTSAPSQSTSPARTPTLALGKGPQIRASTRHPTDDEPLATPPLPQSGRTSSSTGRASLGGLFNISRLRQNSEPQPNRSSAAQPPLPGTPISTGSKSQSFTLSREPLAIPERQEGDTPAKYLIRLEEAVSRGVVASVLSQSNDEFSKNVLRSYMRGFKFFGDPLDMSIRKLLMVAELPKETQQIDRVLQAFANRYHECNPGVYASPDEAYFIAFSVLILHTDVFNRNNKNKMQKHDYTKNTRGQGVADEILECFYDNISYTPFIRVEDDLDINGDRIAISKPRKNLFTKQSTDASGRPSREPVDPYTIILDSRLDSLRPSLRDVMDLDDHYTYHGTGPSCNFAHLHKSFFKYGSLQILSSRSRPDAFTSPETVANPAEAHPGVVDIKVTKVGILWRKDTKRKKTRSPWQEWGAILTGTQLYFFRNSGWVKSLMHQHDSQTKRSRGTPTIFKPPLEQFKPDVLMSTEDAVALQDLSYKKHKNAFVFLRHGGLEEVFLADSDTELNDWLSKLNYAAAFRTAGVRIRGWVGTNSDLQKKLAASRIDSDLTTRSSETSNPEVAPPESTSDALLTRQIRAARRQILGQKISEADERLTVLHNLLEIQLRNARHLQMLAPIQNKTREQVVLGAGGMAAKIKWTRIDIWRTKCHHDIWVTDLEDDIKVSGALDYSESVASSLLQPVQPSKSESIGNNLPDASDGTMRANQSPGKDAQPATQPYPDNKDGTDGVFESFQIVPATGNHRPKGSWELPPLSFQPARSSVKANPGVANLQAPPQTLVPSESLLSANNDPKAHEIVNNAVKLAAPARETELNEQEALKQVGLSETESPSSKAQKRPETPISQDREQSHLKSPEPEAGEGRPKARRSLQRTLRDSTGGASHHRSKKGRDSASSAVLGEPGSSKTESEGLTRTTGSFTVHGKKASVVNLGSEWQALSPDERLKTSRGGLDEDSSVPARLNNQDDDSLRSDADQRPRPLSTTSFSTNTTEATPFEEAAEEFPLGVLPEVEGGLSEGAHREHGEHDDDD